MTSAPANARPADRSDLYLECVDQAQKDAPWLMEKLLDYTRHNLQRKEFELTDVVDRRTVVQALVKLRESQRFMIDAYGAALRKAVDDARAEGAAMRRRVLTELRFDELELLDAGQVQTHVEVARAQRMTLNHAEAALADFNPLMCAVMGLPSVQSDRNPLHPQVYLRALQEVMTGTGASPAIRMLWTLQLCDLLGRELDALYKRLSALLRERGVRPAGFTVGPGTAVGFHASNDLMPEALTIPGALSGPAGPVLPVEPGAPAVLTAASLHDLLVHDEVVPPVAPADRMAAFAQRFSQEFDAPPADLRLPPGLPELPDDPPPTDFPATLPAALDALDRADHVDEVLDRLAVRAGRARGEGRAALNERMGQDAEGTREEVAREVVLLMMENLSRDERLLMPVRGALQDLEPLLLGLVRHDPRFFSDREHPARRFIDEVTRRSLAWTDSRAPGFAVFFRPVRKALKGLGGLPQVKASHFESALQQMNRLWSEDLGRHTMQRDAAVQALQHAEQRSMMARSLHNELQAMPGMPGVAGEIRDFILGPWAHVLAEARLSDRSGEADPGGYRAVVANLLWAATPHATAANPARLTRAIPVLLSDIRRGLRTIQFPARQTGAFMERLMHVLQAGYQAPGEASAPSADARRAAVPESVSPGETAWPTLPGESWLAPSEAETSGFVGLPERPGQLESLAGLATEEGDAPPSADWAVGTWVEMLNGQQAWVRTQLSWCSAHGTLFLFKQGDGNICSMTRRVRDALVAEGRLRVVANEPFVTGALDAVARAAIFNSLDQNPPPSILV